MTYDYTFLGSQIYKLKKMKCHGIKKKSKSRFRA